MLISTNRKKINNLSLLNNHLFNELERCLDTKLDQNVKDILKQSLNDYEHSMQQRIFEEKDHIINQLKQNLVDLTEKRFRSSLNNSSKEASPAPSHHNISNINESPLLSSNNIEFMLNEKENRIQMLLNELNNSQNEIDKLKQIIKNQDDVILSHNNNLFVRYFFEI